VKIGKLTRWILTIGLVAVALIWLSGNGIRERQMQKELNNSVAISGEQLVFITTEHQQTIAEYTAQKNELEEILGEFIPSISGLIAKFESPGRSIEITEYLYEDAYQANVTILTIKTDLPREQVIKKDAGDGDKITLVVYETSSIQVTAKGEVVALLNFLDKLSARFQASYINQVTINIPEGIYEEEEKEKEEEEEEEEKGITATEPEKAILKINLEIYAYEDENA